MNFFRLVFASIVFGICSLSAYADPDPQCLEACANRANRCSSECNINAIDCRSNCQRGYYTCAARCPDVAPGPQIVVGSNITVLVDSDLFYGSTVVGKVKKGEHYLVTAIQGNWVALQTTEHIAVKGWIALANISL